MRPKLAGHKQTKSIKDYLQLVSDYIDKKEISTALKYANEAIAKLPRIPHTNKDEFKLHNKKQLICYKQNKFIQSLHCGNQALSIALRPENKPGDRNRMLALTRFWFARTLLHQRNFEQAHIFFSQVVECYEKQGHSCMPAEFYLQSVLHLSYICLARNDISGFEGMSKKIHSIAIASPLPLGLQIYYWHMLGEYYFVKSDYNMSRKYFKDCIKTQEAEPEKLHIHHKLVAMIHLSILDMVEDNLAQAIDTLNKICDEAKQAKLNDLYCEGNLLLKKAYELKGDWGRAKESEIRIKRIITTLDITWFYETNRMFEQLFQHILKQSRPQKDKIKVDSSDIAPGRNGVPEILVNGIDEYRRKMQTKATIIGQSQEIHGILTLIDKISPTDLPIMIEGETGTGKELFAHLIHYKSKVHNGPFLAINCGAMPESLLESELFGHSKGAFTGASGVKRGLIELASNGTLFLDEIADMSLSMQQKLLRVIEEQSVWKVGSEKPLSVNTRFVFASNRSLTEMLKKGILRQDFYYRINTLTIFLPPLRERKEDIKPLIEYFVSRYSPDKNIKFSDEVLNIFVNYPWPGNVRELENEIKRICLLYKNEPVIKTPMLSDYINNYLRAHSGTAPSKGLTIKELRKTTEKDQITETLKQCQGNVSAAARRFGYNRLTLYRKMKQYGITPSVT